jgi:ADP-ribose pyrophosphatase YjhB (NUDIX family)
LPPEPSPGPSWLRWSRALQSIGQTGLTYSHDPYDVERYREVLRVAAEIGAAGSGGDTEAIAGFFSSQRGYPTPKVDVRGAVIVDGSILLVRERDDSRWSMPGGWADIGESAAEAVQRETWEETGIEVTAVKLIALYERERHGHPPHPEFSYKAFFACAPGRERSPTQESQDLPGGTGTDVHSARFFARDDLPELSVARITTAEIELAFRHHERPELPTEFD